MVASCLASFAQNKIKDFEVNNEKLFPEFRFNQKSKISKVSQFIEDKTWNRCLKFELTDYRRDPKTGARSVNTFLIIGGDEKKGGFPCKPNTRYDFSFECKGQRNLVILDYSEWTEKGKISHHPTSIRRFKPQSEWTVYKGHFTTSASARRVGLRVLFWGSEKHKDAMGKIGDYVLLDKIVIEEAAPSLLEKKLDQTPAADLDLKKVYVAPSQAAASPMSDFQQLKVQESAQVQTEFTATAGKDGFLLTIHCQEPEMAKLKANYKTASTSTKIWRDDLVEIFFDAVKSDRRLSQFVVSAGGGRWMGNGVKAIDRFDDWQASVVRDTQGWTITASIPYESLGFESTPPKGTVITFNICRQRTISNELSALSFPNGTFHNKSNWAVLVVDSIAPYVSKHLELARSEAQNPAVAKLMKGLDPTNPALAYAQIQRLDQAVRMAKLAKRKFIVAQLPPTSVNPAIPFFPRELGEAPEAFTVKAAINEYAPLAIALGNTTDHFEEYRIQLSRGIDYENDAAFAKSEQEGLKDENGNLFPMSQIDIRRGVQTKDADTPGYGLRYDLLSGLNQASTVPVPSHEAGLLWLTFDCHGVQPGVYKGYLNVIPLSEPCSSFKLAKDKESFVTDGEARRFPVELEVLPIELAEESPMPVWFCHYANNATTFEFMRKYDMAFFQLTPWWFTFKFNKDGSVSDYDTKKNLLPLLNLHLQAMRRTKMKSDPKLAIAFSAYPVFKRIHIARNNKHIAFNSPEYWNAWRNWVRGIDKIMSEHGIARSEYVVEVFDEPQFTTPEVQAESIRAFAEAKKAAPNVQLMVTNGHPTQAGFEELAQYVDYYYFGQHHIVKSPQDKWAESLKKMKDKRIGVYACGTSLRQDPYRYYRRMPWLALRYDTDSVGLFSFVNHGNGYAASDFYKVPTGGLAYVAGTGAPIPSIRLEAFRVGLMDVRYMKLLESLAAESRDKALATAARKLLASAPYDVETKYPHEKDRADKIRSQAIDLILQLKAKL
jgi:hypothetical protein